MEKTLFDEIERVGPEGAQQMIRQTDKAKTMAEVVLRHARGFGKLFYMVTPNETSFEKLEDVPEPDYITQAAPYFMGMVMVEQLVLLYQGKAGIRLNDGIMSVANGLMMSIKDLLLRGATLSLYIHIYENYRIYDLPWDSPWTWIIAAIGCDFAYYWIHRAAHEVNLLWAGHQVHHSSEEYNLTTALRQSVMQQFGSIPFYLPLALFVPTTHVLVHVQFNTLFQFWIHTEAIDTMGPLEYILNTPQHHRVHHGSNRYCLDKNYAGALIIWDRLFGTFEWERKDEKIVYGLVDQPQFFNPLRHQVFYYGKIWEKAQTMNSFRDKVSAFLKGPGWFPGTPRLGDIKGVPKVQHRQKYNPDYPTWLGIYCSIQFLTLLVTISEDFPKMNITMSQTSVLLITFFLLWSLTSLGQLFDKAPGVWKSEFLRATLLLSLHEYYGCSGWVKTTIPPVLIRVCLVATTAIAVLMMTMDNSQGKKNKSQ